MTEQERKEAIEWVNQKRNEIRERNKEMWRGLAALRERGERRFKIQCFLALALLVGVFIALAAI